MERGTRCWLENRFWHGNEHGLFEIRKGCLRCEGHEMRCSPFVNGKLTERDLMVGKRERTKNIKEHEENYRNLTERPCFNFALTGRLHAWVTV